MTDNQRISIGNAENFPDTRGWFVGSFLADNAGLRRTNNVEVKWSTHPAGDQRPAGVSGPSGATTLTILISGRFEVIYSGETPSRTLLTKQGDYAMFGPAVAHTWRAIDDSVMLTVRWTDANAQVNASRR